MKLRLQLVGAATALLVAGGLATVSSSAATADTALPTFTITVQSPGSVNLNGTTSVPVVISCTDTSFAFVDVRLAQLYGRQLGSTIASTTTGCSATPQTIIVSVPHQYANPVYAVATATGCNIAGCGSGTASASINLQ